VGKQTKVIFDAKVFLAKVGGGKAILEYRKKQIIFAQGEVADSVFYIQKGSVKLTVISEQGVLPERGSRQPVGPALLFCRPRLWPCTAVAGGFRKASKRSLTTA